MDADADRLSMDDPKAPLGNDTPRRLPNRAVVWELHEVTGLRTLGGGLRCFLIHLKIVWYGLCDQHGF